MTPAAALALQTLTQPAAVARRLIALELSREQIWLGLLTVAALNALISSAAIMFGSEIDVAQIDMNDPVQSQLLSLLANPLLLFAFLAGGLFLMSHALVFASHSTGGGGRFEDVLLVLIWLQLIRAALRILLFFLTMLSPAIAVSASMAGAIITFWIMLHFLSQSLGLHSLLHAFGIFVGVIVVAAFVLAMILALSGVADMEVPNV